MTVGDIVSHLCAEFTELDCIELYHKAITESPTVNLHVAKAMTIGPPRVGKTSLRHHLLELKPPEVIVSTPVMKTAETVTIIPEEEPPVKSVMIHLGKSKSRKFPWLLVNEASGVQSLLRFLQKQVELATAHKIEAAKELQTVTTDDVQDVVAEPVNTTQPQPEPTEGNSSDHRAVENELVHQEEVVIDIAATASKMYHLLQCPDIIDVELADCKLLQFLDCGGQLAYHDILPVFTTIPTVYLHVFNLNEDLKSCPVDRICFSQDGGEVYASAKSPLTVAEMMARSIMTVNALIDKNLQLPKDVLQSEPPEPRVVLVGTHLDKVADRCGGEINHELQSVNMALKDGLDSPSLCLKQMLVRNQNPDLPPMFFPVAKLPPEQGEEDECSELSMNSIIELKRKIEKLVSAVKVKVPIKWYLHQMLEVSRSKEDHKPVHVYSDLYQSCLREKVVGDLGEFYVMVTYFHALGLLIHLCGEDVPHNEDSACLVFTDPSYLFENITKLFQVQFLEEDRCEGSLQPLRCQGKLTKKALRALNIDNAFLSDDDFMNILVQLFIGADITERVAGNDDRVLFVPSVIPVISSTDQHSMITGPSCPYFIITFKDKFFIPCGVFTGAIARLLSIPGWKLLYKSVSRLRTKFSVGTHDTVYVIDNSTHIKVAMVAHTQHNVEQCRNVVLDAVAQSYCFLFHGKSSKSHGCGICNEKPFLVLGLLCHCTTCEHNCGANISELCTNDRIPQTVRCQVSGDPETLNCDQLSLFWNIQHYVSHIIHTVWPEILAGIYFG